MGSKLELVDYPGIASKISYLVPGTWYILSNVETGMVLERGSIGSVYPWVSSTPLYPGKNPGILG